MYDWSDIAERALWTFVQAFLATLPVAGFGTDWAGWLAFLLSGLMAGIAAVLSLIKNVARQRLEA
jgi:hypothetical protein